MDELHPGYLVSLLVLLVACSAFFSCVETALLNLDRYRLRLQAKQGLRGARRSSWLLLHDDRLRGTLLFGRTLVNVSAAALASWAALRHWGVIGLAVAIPGMTLLLLLFGALLPRRYGALRSERVALPLSLPLLILQRLCWPLLWLLTLLSNALLRLLGVAAAEQDDSGRSRDEEALHPADNPQASEVNRHDMLLGLLDLEKVTVNDLMIPRNEIEGIDLDDELEVIVEQLRTTSHTRLPVYRDDVNQIEGVVHMRQIARLLTQGRLTKENLRQACMEPYFVPESTPLSTQLVNFQKEKRRIGVVVDEYGEVIGIVTLEDILEEIVGDFNDLDSLDNPDIQAQEDGSFVIDGSANLRELNKSLGWQLPCDGPKTQRPGHRSPGADPRLRGVPAHRPLLPGNPAVGGKPCEKRARLASPRADPAGRKRRQRLIRDCRTRPAALYNRPQLIQPCRRFRRYPQPEPRPVTRQSRLPARPRCRRYQPAHGAQPHPPCATDLVRPTRAPRRRIGALAITIRPHGSTPSCPDCQGPSHHDRRHPRRRRRSGTGQLDHPGRSRQLHRHRHRVLRFLRLCHCRRPGDRSGILPADIRHRADAQRLPHLRHRLPRPSAGLGAVRPLRRPHRAQVDPGRLAAADGGIHYLIGVLPGYDSIGYWAPLLLCVLRFGQGLGLGGEWGGAALLATENAPAGKRAWFGMFPQLGPSIGFLAANGLFLALAMLLSEEQFREWGWRIPFLLSAALVVVGLYVRLKLAETPVFAKAMAKHERVRLPIAELFAQHWRPTLLGALAMVVCYALFYISTVFSLSYGVASLGFSREEFLGLLCLAVLFMAAATPLSAWLSDRFGRKPVLLLGSLAAIASGFAMEPLLSQGSTFSVALFLCIELFLMGVTFAPMGALLPEIFPTHVRYTGASAAYNLGGILGASVAPYIAQKLVGIGGLGWVGGYVSAAALLSLLAVLCLKETRDNDLGAVS